MKTDNPDNEAVIYNKKGSDLLVRMDDVSAVTRDSTKLELTLVLTNGKEIIIPFNDEEALTKERKLFHTFLKTPR